MVNVTAFNKDLALNIIISAHGLQYQVEANVYLLNIGPSSNTIAENDC